MAAKLRDKTIVIVEDDSFVCQGLATFLGHHNTVKAFGTAEEALASEASLGNVDAFVLDYKLPGADGIELFRHFRPLFPKAKYVLITGEMSYEMADESRKLGFDALILKPFDVIILEENILALLEEEKSS